MKALVRESLNPYDFVYKDVPKPEYKEDQVLIRIEAVGICGTDVHIYEGKCDTNIPVIVGHEFSGVVEEIGSKVAEFKPGDKIVSRLNIGSCGKCRACLTGNAHMCVHRTCPGFAIDGAYAEYIAIEEKQLVKLSPDVDLVKAALMEPMAIVTTGMVLKAKIEPEDFVVVQGAGPIGLIAVQMAKIYGASKVVVTGTNRAAKSKFPIAEKIGADRCVNTQQEDLVDVVMEMTGGKGADLVVECSGVDSSINSSFRLLRKMGRMAVLGLPTKPVSEIEWLTAANKSLEVYFSYSSMPLSWNIAASMLNRGAFDPSPIQTHVMGMSEYQKMFDGLHSGEVVKGVFLPSK